MSRFPARRRTGSALLLLATGGLAGCGGSAPPPAAVASERAIFISAKDCAANSKIELVVCEKIIDAAIGVHVQNAPTYLSVKGCETVEGPDRCERTAARAYRPRLLAFLVTMASPATADPLYSAAPDAGQGFRSSDRKTTILGGDDAYTFSRLATAALEQ